MWPARGQVGVVLLALSGIVALPGLAEPYLLPKATSAAVGATLVLSVPRRSGLPTVMVWLLAAGAVTLAAAALVSETPWAAVGGRSPRYEGLWVLPVYAGALVAGARMRSWPTAHRALPQVLAPAAGLVALVAMLQAVGVGDAARVGSLLGNASELGTWAVIVGVYLAGIAAAGDRVAVAGAAASGVAVVLSASRGALAALTAGLLLVALARFTQVRQRTGPGRWTAPLLALGVAGSAVLLALVVPATRDRLFGDSPLAWATVAGRRWLWSDTLDLIAAHPLLGVGPSGFVDAIGAHHSLGWARYVGPVNPPDSPHNLILQALTAGGLILAALLAALAVVWATRAWGSWRTEPHPTAACSAAVLAGVLALMTHLTSAATLPLLCLLAGWVTAAPQPRPTGSGRARLVDRATRWVPAAGLGGCALVLAAATAAEAPVATALQATARGDHLAASRSWESAHRLRPWDTDLWLRHATATTQGATTALLPAPACLAPTARAHTRLPTSSEAAHTRAECLEANNDLTTAAAVLTAAREHDPTNLNLILLAGVVAARGGDPDTAEALLLHATTLAPGQSGVWTNLAQLYEQTGRTDQAAAARERAAQLTR